jgi:hypothetical protein
MAHFAQLDQNNIVVQVIVVNNNELMVNNDESEEKGILFCQSLFPNTRWMQTSYNASFRKNYAGIGYSYDSVKDAFIPPQPFASWILNENLCLWEAPINSPQDGKQYNWDEETLSWIEVVQ